MVRGGVIATVRGRISQRGRGGGDNTVKREQQRPCKCQSQQTLLPVCLRLTGARFGLLLGDFPLFFLKSSEERLVQPHSNTPTVKHFHCPPVGTAKIGILFLDFHQPRYGWIRFAWESVAPRKSQRAPSCLRPFEMLCQT